MTGLKRCGIYIVYKYIHTTQHIHTYIHTKEYYSAVKERNPAICSKEDGLYVTYTKWNESEKQVLHDITYMWI